MIYHVDARLYFDVEAKNDEEASDKVFDLISEMELPEGITLIDKDIETDLFHWLEDFLAGMDKQGKSYKSKFQVYMP